MADWDILLKGNKLEFDTQSYADGDILKINTNKFLLGHNSYTGSANTQRFGRIQVLSVNTTTWDTTTAGARLNIETQSMTPPIKLAEIDTNHFLAIWGNFSVTNKGRAQVVAVNTSTWAVTTAGARFDYVTDKTADNVSIVKIDTNHFLVSYSRYGAVDNEYNAQVLAVNTTTWAVTTAGARFKVDTADQGSPATHRLIKVDTNHFVMVWEKSGASLGRIQVLAVNTTTWAVTTAGARLDFSTYSGDGRSLIQIDSTHFLNSWKDQYIGPNAELNGVAQVLIVNTSTWAVSTAVSKFVFETLFPDDPTSSKLDVNHFLHIYRAYLNADWTSYAAVAQVLAVNTTTWAVTTSGARLTFETNIYNSNGMTIRVDINHYLHIYSYSDADGFAQVLEVKQPTKDKFFALL